MTQPGRPERHSVQLVSVWASEIGARRRTARQGDPIEPRLTPRFAELVSQSDDGRALTARLRVSIRVRLSDTETWDAHIVLMGHFTSKAALPVEQAEGFARASGLYVLWPYARAALDQAARLSNVVTAPQLPLIVRPGPTPVRPPEPRKE